MLIKIIAVGKIKDRNLNSKIDEFLKWLGPYAKVEIQELKDSAVEREGEALLKILAKERGQVFVLSEEGEEFTSVEFSRKIDSANAKIIFVIGGPFGVAPEVKKQADCLMSLSKMTFTHEMARLFLIEQIYRAVNISKGGKYHNE